MDPQAQFCPNPHCPASGQTAAGQHQGPLLPAATLPLHDLPQDLRRHHGHALLPPAQGPGLVRLRRHPAGLRLPDPGHRRRLRPGRTHGRPPGRTRPGTHAQAVHHHFLRTSVVDLQHVQADEICGKTAGGRCWLAMAMAVPYRLWLGGVVSPVRDLHLIQHLVDLVRLAWTPGRTLLICVDGLASYVTAFRRAFREKVHTGRRGRPPYRLPRGVLLGQVVKNHSGRRLVGVRPACGLGQPRADRPGVAADRDGPADQHVVHRAAQRHVPQSAGEPGASGAGPGPQGGDVGAGDVSGGLRLQLLHGASQPADLGYRGHDQVAGAYTSDGRRLDRSGLVGAGTPLLQALT